MTEAELDQAFVHECLADTPLAANASLRDVTPKETPDVLPEYRAYIDALAQPPGCERGNVYACDWDGNHDADQDVFRVVFASPITPEMRRYFASLHAHRAPSHRTSSGVNSVLLVVHHATMRNYGMK
jgi:hypothetical protein